MSPINDSVNIVSEETAKQVLELATQLHSQHQPKISIDDLVQAGLEAQVPPIFIEQALQQILAEKVQAQKRDRKRVSGALLIGLIALIATGTGFWVGRHTPGFRQEPSPSQLSQSSDGLLPHASQADIPSLPRAKQSCSFSGLNLPKDAAVYAAGAYSGQNLPYPIDQSGHQATPIDVTVNSPNQPAILMLGADEPNLWSIRWTKGTNIVAVVVSGYHRQVVGGLPKHVPLLMHTEEAGSRCGSFYGSANQEKLSTLNAISRSLFQRSVDKVFLTNQGTVTIGEALHSNTVVITADEGS